MTKSCVVFGCHNRAGKPGCEGLSFYRLLLKNKKLLKAWLARMRTDSVRVNENSSVCSAHFEGGKKQGVNDVPSIFPWTVRVARKAPARRTADSSRTDDAETSSIDLSLPEQGACDHGASFEPLAESSTQERVEESQLEFVESSVVMESMESEKSRSTDDEIFCLRRENENLKVRLRDAVFEALSLQMMT